MKARRGTALLLAILLLQVLVACVKPPSESGRTEVLTALDRSLGWLDAHPPDPDTAKIGEIALDTWPWTLFSRLHPDPEIRKRSAGEAKARLQRLRPEVEATFVALSYWVVLLRNLEEQGLDTAAYREALSRVDIDAVLASGNPTTNFWITELLRFSGIPGESRIEETFLATSAANGISRFEPKLRGVYALYHEIAPVTDLGREPIRVFSKDQVEFARRILPALLEVSQRVGDTDAVAEVLITASILGERKQSYYSEGIKWLLAQQREDGTYRDARTGKEKPSPIHFRHAVLVVSWALLESLQ